MTIPLHQNSFKESKREAQNGSRGGEGIPARHGSSVLRKDGDLWSLSHGNIPDPPERAVSAMHEWRAGVKQARKRELCLEHISRGPK